MVGEDTAESGSALARLPSRFGDLFLREKRPPRRVIGMKGKHTPQTALLSDVGVTGKGLVFAFVGLQWTHLLRNAKIE